MKSKIKIYTSYWGNLKKLRKDNIMPIGISRFPPRHVKDVISDKRLAPKANMLKMPKEKFDPLYDEILSELNPCQFVENLEKISGGRDVALLCFEKPGDYCHRTAVADWISENTGLKVYEYGYAPSQLELF
jgi:uncharacterized protein YeaO (DUF488 family)